MSTTPESNYQLEGNKVIVSLNLKIPLQFEIELGGIQDTQSGQLNYQENLQTAISENSDLMIEKINQAEIDQQAQILSSQLATQVLFHMNKSKLSSDNLEEKLKILSEKDSSYAPFNSENTSQSNQQLIYNSREKRKVRFADSLNDSLTLAVNFVGAMLFLGKLANYSWE